MAGNRICPINAIIHMPFRRMSRAISRRASIFARNAPLFATKGASVVARPTPSPGRWSLIC
jgi:hypothetical protein